MATEVEKAEEITAFEDMTVAIIEVVKEAVTLAPRSRLQAMAIPCLVQTISTLHRLVWVIMFRQMVKEGADIPCPAIRLFSSLPNCVEAMDSKPQPF